MEVPTHLKQAFTPEQLREHRELFDSFDEDGGGTIDAPEMAKLADALGLKVTVDGAKKLIEEIDLDGDGLVDFVEFLTLLVDLQAGGLDREKMKKSSQLTQLMSMAVKRADEVRARKEEKIAAAQKGRELIVAQNEIEREGKAKNAKKLKEQEKILIVKRNEASRRASLQRLDEEDRKIEEAIAAKDDIIRQKAAEGQRRAEEEKKKVFLLAEEKGAVLLKKGADSQVRKLQLAEEDEVKRVSIELEKRKQRAIAARRADIERGFTRVQLEALREQFDATDTDNSQSIDAGELYAVCQKLGEDLTMKQIKKLIAEVDDDNSGEIEWEEYLLIMGKKRDEAMKKGSGLFQKMSMRADQAAIKKQEKIDVLQRQKEEQYAVQEVARREAVERASKQKVLEQEAIIAKNIAKEEEALIRVENVEVEKEVRARCVEFFSSLFLLIFFVIFSTPLLFSVLSWKFLFQCHSHHIVCLQIIPLHLFFSLPLSPASTPCKSARNSTESNAGTTSCSRSTKSSVGNCRAETFANGGQRGAKRMDQTAKNGRGRTDESCCRSREKDYAHSKRTTRRD